MKIIDNLLRPFRQCSWRYYGNDERWEFVDIWQTDCDHLIEVQPEFDDSLPPTPTNAGYRFCPYCGRQINEIPHQWTIRPGCIAKWYLQLVVQSNVTPSDASNAPEG